MKNADPGPRPGEGSIARERDAWERANERFLAEGFKPGVSQVPATVDPTDRRLAELRKDHRKFMDMHSPMKAAIWLALLRDASAVIHDVEMTRRFKEAQQGGNAGDYIAPHRPSIVEIGQQLVARGLDGDISAIREIAERVEGKAGLRIGDDDPEEPGRKRQTQQIVSSVVAAMTTRRIGENKVIDVESTPVSVSPPPAPRETQPEPLPPSPPTAPATSAPTAAHGSYELELESQITAVNQLEDEVQAQEQTRRILEAKDSERVQAEACLVAREKALIETQERAKIHEEERAKREAQFRIEAEARDQARVRRMRGRRP